MTPLSYRLVGAGELSRDLGYDSGWRAFGNTLITYVVSGVYVLVTESGERVEVGRGMAFLVPPGLRHRVQVPSADGLTARFVHLTCRISDLLGIFTLLDHAIVFDGAIARRIARHHRALVGPAPAPGGIARSARISAHLAELVAIGVEASPELERWSDPERQRLLPVLAHIQAHLADEISRDDLARVVGVSVPHLHTLCVRTLGRTPMDMVRGQRLERARELLHWSQLPIAEVGRLSGFPDPYYFSRAFTRAEGVSPRTYRAHRHAG